MRYKGVKEKICEQRLEGTSLEMQSSSLGQARIQMAPEKVEKPP